MADWYWICRAEQSPAPTCALAPVREAMERAVREADDLMAYRFAFTNPWDMEPCRKVYAVNPRRFRYPPNGDPEWVYMLSRMEYLNKLLLAHAHTGERRYVDFYLRFLLDIWYPAYGEPARPGGLSQRFARLRRKLGVRGAENPRRTLDIAIRNVQIRFGMRYLDGCGLLSEADRARLDVHLARDDAFLEAKYDPAFDDTSNWGLIILASRLCCRLMDAWSPEASENAADLARRIAALLDAQISESGTHLEGAPMYEAQIAVCLLRAVRLAKARGLALPLRLTDALRRMLSYLHDLTDPENRQLMIGDSDRTEMSSFFLLACHALKTDAYGGRTRAPYDLSLLFDCPDALEMWAQGQFRADLHDVPLRLFEGENTAVLREGGRMLVCLNGRHVSGHSHADGCETLYALHGKMLLIDCGRYSYQNNPTRRALRAARAHTIPTFDDSPEWRVRGAWAFDSRTENPLTAVCARDGLRCVKMTCRGGGAEIARYAIFGDEELLLIDLVRAPGEHVQHAFFNFDPEWACSVENGQVALACGDARAFLCADGETALSLEKTIVSYHYNQKVEGVRGKASRPMRDLGVIAVWIGEEIASVTARIEGDSARVFAPNLRVRIPVSVALSPAQGVIEDKILREGDTIGIFF